MFALKAGAGFGYLFSRPLSPGRRLYPFLAYALFMGAFFLLAHALGGRIDRVSGLGLFQLAASYGMHVHFLVASGLLAWGISVLLRDEASSRGGTRAWLLLSLPCPVCLTVIFLDVAMLSALFPRSLAVSTLLPCLFFVLVAGLSGLAFKRAAGMQSAGSPEHLVGWTMIFAAAYFVSAMLLIPHYKEAHSVFDLSVHEALSAGPPGTGVQAGWTPVAVLFSSLFLGGMFSQRRRP